MGKLQHTKFSYWPDTYIIGESPKLVKTKITKQLTTL